MAFVELKGGSEFKNTKSPEAEMLPQLGQLHPLPVLHEARIKAQTPKKSNLLQAI